MPIKTHSMLAIERSSFCIGTLLSLFLLHCILRSTKCDLGAYKYLQVLFVSIDLSYAAFHVVLGTRFIAQDSVMLIIGLGRYASSFSAITAFLAFYSLTFVIIDLHFLYRLWAIKSPSKVALFSRKWFIFLIIAISVAEYSFWCYLTVAFMAATDHGRIKMRNITFEKFGVDSLTQDMVMADYFNDDGSRNWDPAVAVIVICIMLELYFGFMIYASVNIVRYLHGTKAASNARLALQRQLFVALSAQTLIPFFLLYSPCGIEILFPFFGWDAEIVADFAPLSLSLFMPFDAIAVLYLMKDYRRAVLNVISCGRFDGSKIHLVKVSSTTSQSNFNKSIAHSSLQ